MNAVALPTILMSGPALREPLAAVKPRALFAVDYENVCRALGDAPFHLSKGAARDQSVAMLVKMRLLTEEAGYDVYCAKAFADWGAMPWGAQRALSIAGIDPCYVASLRGKSSTDIELSLVVLEMVLSDESINHVVIAGGDRDYLPIARRLRHFGRSVTIATLSTCIGTDLKTFVTSSPHGTVLELDSWVASASVADDASDDEAAEGMDSEKHAFDLAASDEPPSTEPSAVIPMRVARRLTQAQLSLVETMQSYMRGRGVYEIHLAPFFRHLHDGSRFGLQEGPHPKKVFEELKAIGVIEVVRRPARDGGDFAVALLRQDRILAETADVQRQEQLSANDNGLGRR